MECYNINLKNEENDKAELLSLNINDSFLMKDEINTYNSFKDNKLLRISNDIIEKEFNNINCLKIFEENDDEKIINNSFKCENETISNSNKLFYKDSIIINDDTTKKQLLLKRKREWAKEGRIRKKQFIENLIKENCELKIVCKNLINIIDNCPKCKEKKEKLELLSKNENKNEKNNSSILDNEPKFSNKKKLLFLTGIAILSIINIFHIPLNIMSYYNFIYNNKIEYLRNLNENYTIEERYNNTSNILINKLSTSNGDKEALYIHLAEFYSITKREKITNKSNLEKEKDKNIKIFKENQIDQINENNVNDCVKCMVEVDKNSIKLGGDEFTFYLANRHLSKFFVNNTDGVFPEINFDENNKKYDSFSKFYALKCKILAYSINELYSQKINLS